MNIYMQYPGDMDIEGVFIVPTVKKDRKKFKFSKVSEPPLSEYDPAQIPGTQVYGQGRTEPGRIVMHNTVFQALQNDFNFSHKIENGGYLLAPPKDSPVHLNSRSILIFHGLLKSPMQYWLREPGEVRVF